MDESFRRAIRKMTGRSLVRFGGRPQRAQVLDFMAQAMEPSYSIVLKEHLEHAMETHWEVQPGEEYISHGPESYKACISEFPALADEFREKFEDYRQKWVQRLTPENLLDILKMGNWIQTTEKGEFKLNFKGNAQEIRNLYFETVHLLVGDAEKLLVMMNSRLLHLQDRLAHQWLSELSGGPETKILPSLEKSLRGRENQSLKGVRDGLSLFAFKRFTNAFKNQTKTNQEVFPTELALVRSLGRVWNPIGIWETGVRGLLEDFTDYSQGVCLLICDWYQNKWSLFLRGFSRGQLDLFARVPPQLILDTKEET